MSSDKYIFKKKLSIRRKTKRRLFSESAFMFILSLLLVYINYLIINKNFLLQNFFISLNKSLVLLIDLFFNIYQIILVLFIFISPVVILFLLIGSFYRIIKVLKRKKSQFIYK